MVGVRVDYRLTKPLETKGERSKKQINRSPSMAVGHYTSFFIIVELITMIEG